MGQGAVAEAEVAQEAPVDPQETPDAAAGIAESDAPTSPEAAEAGDVEEGQEGEGTSDAVGEFLTELGSGATPEQIRGFLETLPAEVRSEALAEELRRAEQRGRNQATEEVQTHQQAREAQAGVVDAGRQARARLQEAVGDGGDIDRALARLERLADTAEPEEIKRAASELADHLFHEERGVVPNLNTFIAGSRREAAQMATQDLTAALNESFGPLFKETDGAYDLTAEEKAAIDAAKTAGAKMGALTRVALERAKTAGEKAAYDKALKKAREEAGVLERYERIKGGIPPQSGGRAQAARSDAEILADPHTPIKQIQEIRRRQLRGE